MLATRRLGVSDLPRDRQSNPAPAGLLRKIHLVVVCPGIGTRISSGDTRKATETSQANCESADCDNSLHSQNTLDHWNLPWSNPEENYCMRQPG